MDKPVETENGSNYIDVHVGGSIRRRRKELKISQEKLAEDLGVSFQQVQKYERGANRVSASKLYEVACSLHAPIKYFFDGLPDPLESVAGMAEPPTDSAFNNRMFTNPEVVELAEVFVGVKQARLRRKILKLVRLVAEEDE
jgi:transcriptional regulator with XRE-family HTH domain